MQTIGHKAFDELRFEDAHSARSRVPLELDGGDVMRRIEEGRAASLGERRERACVSARKVIMSHAGCGQLRRGGKENRGAAIMECGG